MLMLLKYRIIKLSIHGIKDEMTVRLAYITKLDLSLVPRKTNDFIDIYTLSDTIDRNVASLINV